LGIKLLQPLVQAVCRKLKKYWISAQRITSFRISASEEAIVEELFNSIGTEYQNSIDDFSRDVMIAQIELWF
jgi:hypothetical protein